MGLIRTGTPPALPVSLQELRLHCRVDDPAEDPALVGYARAASDLAEARSSVTLTASTFRQTFPCFTDSLVLSRKPLISVESVKYIDTAGAEQTLATSVYLIQKNEVEGRVDLAPDQTWPAIQARRDAVAVEYTAGFGTAAADVPEGLRQAVLMLAAHYYRNREAAQPVQMQALPFAVESLLAAHSRPSPC